MTTLLGPCLIIIIMAAGITTAVTLVDNGYEEVYIVINNGVKEHPELISRIKEIFSEGSRQLFECTKNRVYFRKITIVIPNTWTRNDNYKVINKFPFSREIVMVDSPSHHGNKPYVQRTEGCGAPGLFLHLTPELILADNMPDGDTWEGLNDDCRLYGRHELQRLQIYHVCSRDMRGRALLKKNSMACDLSSMSIYPPSDCIFCPDTNQSAKASILSASGPSVTLFTGKDHESVDKALRHNVLAPNEQNIRCDYKSAWEVMRDHADFKQKGNIGWSLSRTYNFSIADVNDPRYRDTETGPVFDFVQNMDIYFDGDIYIRRFSETSSAYGSFFIASGEKENVLMVIVAPNGSSIHAKIRGPSGYIIDKKEFNQLWLTIKEKGVYYFFVEIEIIAGISVYVGCSKANNGVQHSKVQGWLSHTRVDYQEKPDLKVFVFVKKAQFPIANAIVVAVLERPDKMAITFNLYDDGLGTDLMKDDGIYTGNIFMYYLSGNGFYSVRIFAMGGRNTKVIKDIQGKLSSCSDNGQSVIYEDIDNFQRVTEAGRFEVIHFEDPFRTEVKETTDRNQEIRTVMTVEDPNIPIAPFTTEKIIEIIDDIPPSKISDFYQVSYEESEGIRRCFRFRWTSVGNDRNLGQAMRYNIRYSSQMSDLLTNLDKCTALDNNTMVPKIAGSTEEIFVIGDVDNNYALKESFIAINAVDRAGNAAKISNIAIIPHTVNLTIVPLDTKCVVEREPPSRITDLKIQNETYIQMKDEMITACFELTWTAVGDEEKHGQAQAYEILYSEEVTNLVFVHRTNSIRNTIVPLKAGGKETVTIRGVLESNYRSKRQYITVRTVSKRRIYSDVSNYIDIPLVLNLTLTTNITTCKLPNNSVESISTKDVIIAICSLIFAVALSVYYLPN